MMQAKLHRAQHGTLDPGAIPDGLEEERRHDRGPRRAPARPGALGLLHRRARAPVLTTARGGGRPNAQVPVSTTPYDATRRLHRRGAGNSRAEPRRGWRRWPRGNGHNTGAVARRHRRGGVLPSTGRSAPLHGLRHDWPTARNQIGRKRCSRLDLATAEQRGGRTGVRPDRLRCLGWSCRQMTEGRTLPRM